MGRSCSGRTLTVAGHRPGIPRVKRVPVPVRARLPECLPVSPCAPKCDPGHPATIVQDFPFDQNFNVFTVSKLQLQHDQALKATTSTRSSCMLISNGLQKIQFRKQLAKMPFGMRKYISFINHDFNAVTLELNQPRSRIQTRTFTFYVPCGCSPK